MSTSTELLINDDHPLSLELASLRQAVHRFQHEAHSSALKLQRHSLETSLALERAHALERENTQIREEIAVLRSHPDVTPTSAALQVPELTLALRRLNDKLSATEETLISRTNELAHALAQIAKGKLEVESAYALAAHTRAQQEEGKARERELRRRVHMAEEERDMTDTVVREYADLVRSLERKQGASLSGSDGNGHTRSSSTVSNLSEVLQDGRSGVRKLTAEFAAESERLEAEIVRLHTQLEVIERERDVERKVAEFDRTELARTRAELDRVSIDDSTATRMVSRYMKFSQSTTDTLQTALENLKTRHAATITTRDQQLASLQAATVTQQRQFDRLRDSLDELTEQLARESYGRRREISLRLAVAGREDGLAEALRRWIRRARETYERADSRDDNLDALRDAFLNIVDDAEQLIALVNGDDEVSSSDGEGGLGAVARIFAAQGSVTNLVKELQSETEKRMRLERMLSRAEIDEHGEVVVAPVATAISDLQRPLPDTPLETPASVTEHKQPRIKPGASSMSVSITAPAVEPLPIAPPGTDAIVSPREKRPTPLPLHNISEIFSPMSPAHLHQPSPRVFSNPPAFISQPTTPPSPSPTESSAQVSPGVVASAVLENPPLPLLSHSIEHSMSDSIMPPAEPVATNPAEPTPRVEPSLVAPSTPSSPADPLLAELSAITSRYDGLQRALRDCHLALKDVASSIALQPASTSRTLLQAAASRLDDFAEDARVELEIRIADEERMARGFATLLSVRGALTSPADVAEAKNAAQAFVDGTDTSVARSQARFDKKLVDLQHDVASLKRTVHELSENPAPAHAPPPVEESPDRSWSSLAAGLFTPSRSSSPAPPTFGALMATPRLRRQPSSPRLGAASINSNNTTTNSFAALGLDLRVPMPEHVPGLAAARASPVPRQRTTSGMYMLGLGMRSTPSFGASPGSPARKPSALAGARRTSGATVGISEQDVIQEKSLAGDSDVE